MMFVNYAGASRCHIPCSFPVTWWEEENFTFPFTNFKLFKCYFLERSCTCNFWMCFSYEEMGSCWMWGKQLGLAIIPPNYILSTWWMFCNLYTLKLVIRSGHCYFIVTFFVRRDVVTRIETLKDWPMLCLVAFHFLKMKWKQLSNEVFLPQKLAKLDLLENSLSNNSMSHLRHWFPSDILD